MRQYLQFVADQRLAVLSLQPMYGARNPLAFMELQDVQELAYFASTIFFKLSKPLW